MHIKQQFLIYYVQLLDDCRVTRIQHTPHGFNLNKEPVNSHNMQTLFLHPVYVSYKIKLLPGFCQRKTVTSRNNKSYSCLMLRKSRCDLNSPRVGAFYTNSSYFQSRIHGGLKKYYIVAVRLKTKKNMGWIRRIKRDFNFDFIFVSDRGKSGNNVKHADTVHIHF